MPSNKPCNHNELVGRVVALEAGLIAFRELMDERDKRYMQRANAQDVTVATALASSDRAIGKAELATEKRLEGLNEIRTMALDQAKTFMPETEVKLLTGALEVRIEALSRLLSAQVAHGGGIKDAWGYFVAAVGLGIAALAVYFRH